MELRDGYSKVGVLEFEGKRYKTPAIIPIEKLKSLDSGVSLKLKTIDPERFKILRKERELFVFNVPPTSPEEFVKLLLDSFKLNRVVYAPAIATAYNIPILAYLGIDVFDTALADILAETGVFMTDSGEILAESLKENFCCCKVCSREGERVLSNKKLLREHNLCIMESRVKLTRDLIRRGELRNFVESEVKHSPFYTAVLRLFDSHCRNYFPRFRKSKAIFCSQESFSRPEVIYFLKRVSEVYTRKTDGVLVLPCSAKKPYLLSKTHSTIQNALKEVKVRVNEIIVSSPLVTPREFELCYPACNYDVAVTGSWGRDEVEFVSDWLAKLLDGFEIAGGYVSGGYRKVLEKACEKAGTECKIIEDLKGVKEFVEEYGKKIDLYKDMFRMVSTYQFGKDIVEFLEGRKEKVKIKGKYPEIELITSKRVARFDRKGMIDVYTPEFLKDSDYAVKIEDFKPRGTIFAAGIIKAEEAIKPGDVVGFFGDRWMGVGVARITGWEMENLEEGYAIDVKRVQEKFKL